MARANRKRRKPHVKKGDMVMLNKTITAGEVSDARDAGYTGKVLKVFPDKDRIIVEGVNLRVRHTKPNQLHPQGGRVQREMPIHMSNVQPIDSEGNATRIGRKRIDNLDAEGGRWIRYAKTTGEELDT